ncbi:MAG: 3-deoxy-7-phosphoheptulonate synthase [Spirochaetaceae bacterium]|nr:MAG: 3-deoxy-7-phosphoheptulonate synthase [Spirochaetaceae bacterium]
MVIVLERSIREDHKNRIRDFLETHGFRVREIVGEEETIFGAVGQLSIDLREVEVLPGVARVIPISKPYKLASRELQKDDSVVRVGPVRVGGRRIAVIAGPCSVEGRDEILEAARLVRKSGAVMLRGGAYKPRTSPYAFQGLAVEGLRYLKEAGEATGMPVVSEIVSPELIDVMSEYVDVLQIGARNMQNFELLKAIGSRNVPVMLKRGLCATIEEWLMAAEYLLAHGAEHVMLCERGIRTFETYTRNTLDISAIPVVKKLSHLPVIVDPSHATGIRAKVPPVALAAVAAGADGLMVEVHPSPDEALSDGPQSLHPEQFERLMRDIEALAPVVEKEVLRLPERHERVPAFTGVEEPSGDRDTLIAFQGERGAFSELALLRYFHAETVIPSPQPDFRTVFAAVLQNRCRYGIIPLENSLAGSIHENFDLLLQFPDVSIVGEVKIRIIHSLIGTPEAVLGDIKHVYSHPQGLAQCARFLDEHPDWERVPFYDTAGSVAHVARLGDRTVAAIANAEAAAVYKMQVLKDGLETNPQNYTRFAVVARTEDAHVDRPSKASIVFSTPDTPGALLSCMAILSNRNLNLKKLESRPILGKPWQYMFYLDIELPENPQPFEQAMQELAVAAQELRLLGKYRAG